MHKNKVRRVVSVLKNFRRGMGGRSPQLIIFLLSSLLVFAAIIIWPNPGMGQIFSVPPEEIMAPSAALDIKRQGNIEYTDVRLDGDRLFSVAAQGSSAAGGVANDSDIPSIERRVQQVENNLAQVLASELDPAMLRVTAGELNNHPVIFVSDRQGLESLQIVTVTELDVQIAKSRTEAELAAKWVQIIQAGLTTALKERQPEYLRSRAIIAGKILLGAILSSLLVKLCQQFLRHRWCRLQQNCADSKPPLPGMKKFNSLQELAALKPLQFLAMRLPRLNQERQRNVNILSRRFLQWVQVTIWLGGSIWILTLFPQTRELGRWLSQVPMRLIGIVLMIILAKKGIDVLIDFFLEAWAEQESIKPNGFHRQACRVPTFSVAFKGLASLATFVIGMILFLYALRVPIAPVLTGAGIIGFAFSLSAQNLIRDMINGVLILLEDQYAVGDVISVGDELGFVEHMNLRITQLRDPDGELVTIPNGAITTVRNLSNGWSRVNLEIDVSYDTDVDKAMQVMEVVAKQMRSEPEWQPRILEPAQILGIDRIAHTGILIRVWIKTQPLQQWNVSREFRRRLKLAFTEHNIPIGVPQQSLWVRNANDLAKLEQTMQVDELHNGKEDIRNMQISNIST
ncbi:MAG: mechanosensitive ion channel family protein [Cyanothece sp. SIO1E1]|nr:mechanosensitive ion channel family protein [Cyanothece sp. SIO1E1]